MGKEMKLYQLRLKVDTEEEANSIAESLEPDGGWAIEETEDGLYLLAYFSNPPEKYKDNLTEAPDWEERFREGFKGIAVDPFFVRPPWMDERPGYTNIIIYPGTGFGTGEHPTTQGMLKLLAEEPEGGMVLDVGCGSGILSIAAEKLGAERIIACDIDPLAISNCLHNLKLNKCQKVIPLLGSATCLKAKFDIILANLDFFTLVSLRDELCNLLDPRGKLLISGFLVEDEETIKELYRQRGLIPTRSLRIKGWSSLHLERSEVKDPRCWQKSSP